MDDSRRLMSVRLFSQHAPGVRVKRFVRLPPGAPERRNISVCVCFLPLQMSALGSFHQRPRERCCLSEESPTDGGKGLKAENSRRRQTELRLN